MYGLLFKMLANKAASGLAGGSPGLMGGASNLSEGMVEGSSGNSMMPQQSQGVQNLGIANLGKEVPLEAAPPTQATPMEMPMHMAQQTANQIQQPPQSLGSIYMNNLGNRYDDKMKLWNDSDGLLDFARKNRLYNKENGIQGYQPPQQPMLMASAPTQGGLYKNYGGGY